MSETPQNRSKVVAWALWDWGTSAYSAIITTFVFAVYIVSDGFLSPDAAAGADAEAGSVANNAYLAAQADLTSTVAWALAIAGIGVALISPIVGQRNDARGHTKLSLGITTGVVILTTFAMYFVIPDPSWFMVGVVLLAVGSLSYEIAQVSYNSLLLRVATPQNIGRVSGLGWGLGYIGTIVILMISLAGFILGDNYWFGVTSDESQNLRVVFVLAGIWSFLFSIPLFFLIPETPALGSKLGVLDSYRKVVSDLRDLFHESRGTFSFLIASAVFRDGLAGVFAFGGILAGTVFGFSPTEVILFAVAGNLTAGIGVIVAGWFDDKFGSHRVIITSLVLLIISGTVMLLINDLGVWVFWVLGLTLAVFVGPAQAASRSFLARIAPQGKTGEVFGLYQATGRAASFITPTLFGLFVMIAGDTAFGIAAIVLVLSVGLGLMIPIARTAERAQRTVAQLRS